MQTCIEAIICLVPGPIVGAGLLGLVAALITFAVLRWGR